MDDANDVRWALAYEINCRSGKMLPCGAWDICPGCGAPHLAFGPQDRKALDTPPDHRGSRREVQYDCGATAKSDCRDVWAYSMNRECVARQHAALQMRLVEADRLIKEMADLIGKACPGASYWENVLADAVDAYEVGAPKEG